MLRTFQRLGWLVLAMTVVSSASAFSLWGPPNESYQTPVLGYVEPPFCNPAGYIGAPKNLGEEYRVNQPVFYYAFDRSFLDYFGSNGVVAAEQTFLILSNYLTNPNYSFSLSESNPAAYLNQFPNQALRFNHQAAALSMIDLRSVMLGYMVEQLGLTDPIHWTWTLRARLPLPNGCPNWEYHVIQRNFDPLTFEPTRYVNGTLLTYRIIERCNLTPQCDKADAQEIFVDPLAFEYVPTSSYLFTLNYGMLFTGLTRDDMGGFRHLLRFPNQNVESVGPDSLLTSSPITITNAGQPLLLVTSNLNLFVSQALTNNAAQLLALYPNLVITSTTFSFTNLVTTNVTGYYTNYPWQPAGSAPILVLTTTRSTNVGTIYNHTFANFYTVSSNNGGYMTTVTTSVGFGQPWSIPGTLGTNVTSTTTFNSNLLTGSYLILPTNLCSLSIVSTQLITVDLITNQVVAATNASGYAYTSYTVTYQTNYYLVANTVTCVGSTVGGGGTNSPVLRPGIDRIRFVRHDYDSLLGTFFVPLTNDYTLQAIANNQVVTQGFRRLVTSPDIVFAAQDMDVTLGTRTTSIFYTNDVAANYPAGTSLAGPGLIRPRFQLTFNKVGTELINIGPFFMTEDSAITNFIWASFDATTNAPIVYPSGTSLAGIENQVIMNITTSSLPNGTAGSAYPATALTGSGGVTPYTWTAAGGNSEIAPGIFLDPSGVISGVAAAGSAGVYDVSVIMTDAGGRSVARGLTLTVNP